MVYRGKKRKEIGRKGEVLVLSRWPGGVMVVNRTSMVSKESYCGRYCHCRC